MIKRYLIVGIILLFICMSITPSSAFDNVKKSTSFSDGNTLYVGGSGPGNYTRIQNAVDNASAGDTVFVFNGTYYEFKIKIDKSIDLVGENKNSTCIDCQDKYAIIILITISNVIISEFTLKNCCSGGYAQAIYLWGNNTKLHNIYISNCIINRCDKGIFFVNVTNLFIANCIIYNIYGQTTWGYEGNSNVIISDCHAHNNGVNYGGGWITPGSFSFDSDYSDISVINCTIHNNAGPGIYFFGTGDNIEISQNILYKNSWDGTNIYNDVPSITNICLYNNQIFENYINGIFLSGIAYPGIEIYNNNISSNGKEKEFRDGGIYSQISDSNTISIKNNIISLNKGSGIFRGSPNSEIIGNNIKGNTKKGIYIDSDNIVIKENNISENGEGISVFYYHSTITNNLISANKIGINISESNNLIYYNEISNNDRAINIYCGKHGKDNYIFNNNFKNNKRDAFFKYRYVIGYPMNITFNKNYWGRPRILSKPIFGKLNLFGNKIKSGINISWVIFDRNPRFTPYDINTDYNFPKIQNIYYSEESEKVNIVSFEGYEISSSISPTLFKKIIKST